MCDKTIDLLSAARVRKGMKAKEVAAIMEIPPSTFSDFMRGKKRITNSFVDSFRKVVFLTRYEYETITALIEKERVTH